MSRGSSRRSRWTGEGRGSRFVLWGRLLLGRYFAMAQSRLTSAGLQLAIESVPTARRLSSADGSRARHALPARCVPGLPVAESAGCWRAAALRLRGSQQTRRDEADALTPRKVPLRTLLSAEGIAPSRGCRRGSPHPGHGSWQMCVAGCCWCDVNSFIFCQIAL